MHSFARRGSRDNSRILHVVASGERRGAEMFASDLIRVSRSPDLDHHVAILHGGDGDDLSFDAPVSVMGRSRLVIPGLRINVGICRELRRLIKRTAPAVVQAHGGEALKYAVISSRGRSVQVVYRKIGTARPNVRGGIRRSAHRWFMRRAARVVAVADVLAREALETFGIAADRVLVIPSAIDPVRVTFPAGKGAARRALRIPADADVVLSLAALAWEKDPLAHFEVARRVLAARPDSMYVAAGDGPLRRELEAEVGRAGFSDRVRLLGSVSDVGVVLAACDVLILASRTEGLPGSVIEAGFAGLPVAAYALAGVPELVQDGVTGRLVAPGDVNALACAVLDLLGDRPGREQMGRRAHERCAANDITRVVPRYEALYRELSERNVSVQASVS